MTGDPTPEIPQQPPDSIVPTELFQDYLGKLRKETWYLETISGGGFQLSEADTQRLENLRRELQAVEDNWRLKGTREIPLEVSPEDLTQWRPDFFAELPPDVIRSQPESEEAIQSFTYETAGDKLDQLPYVYLPPAHDKGALVYSPPEGQYYQIPVDRIVGARLGNSWASWGSKEAEDNLGTRERSRDVIIRYAQMGRYDPAVAGRGVIGLEVMLGADGETYFFAPFDNHRIAAAKLRGDKTIAV